MHLSSSPPTFLPPHPFFLPPNFLTHVVVSMRGWRLAVLDGKKSRIRIENVCWFKSASLCCPMPLNRVPHCATKELPQLPHFAPCFSAVQGSRAKDPRSKDQPAPVPQRFKCLPHSDKVWLTLSLFLPPCCAVQSLLSCIVLIIGSSCCPAGSWFRISCMVAGIYFSVLYGRDSVRAGRPCMFSCSCTWLHN